MEGQHAKEAAFAAPAHSPRHHRHNSGSSPRRHAPPASPEREHSPPARSTSPRAKGSFPRSISPPPLSAFVSPSPPKHGAGSPLVRAIAHDLMGFETTKLRSKRLRTGKGADQGQYTQEIEKSAMDMLHDLVEMVHEAALSNKQPSSPRSSGSNPHAASSSSSFPSLSPSPHAHAAAPGSPLAAPRSPLHDRVQLRVKILETKRRLEEEEEKVRQEQHAKLASAVPDPLDPLPPALRAQEALPGVVVPVEDFRRMRLDRSYSDPLQLRGMAAKAKAHQVGDDKLRRDVQSAKEEFARIMESDLGLRELDAELKDLLKSLEHLRKLHAVYRVPRDRSHVAPTPAQGPHHLLHHGGPLPGFVSHARRRSDPAPVVAFRALRFDPGPPRSDEWGSDEE